MIRRIPLFKPNQVKQLMNNTVVREKKTPRKKRVIVDEMTEANEPRYKEL